MNERTIKENNVQNTKVRLTFIFQILVSLNYYTSTIISFFDKKALHILQMIFISRQAQPP